MIPPNIINQLGRPITPNMQISFRCQQCGECCRNRSNAPIILTSHDMYRLGQALHVRTTLDLVKMGIVTVCSTSYGMPVCILGTTPTGACCLLDGTLCRVHDSKPVVCAMYPYGRIYDASTGQYTYIHPYGNACGGSGNGPATAASEQLQSHRIHEPFHAAGEQAYADVTMAYLSISRPRYRKRVFNRATWALYCGFDPAKDYHSQLAENMEALRPLLDKATRKRK